jgi:hypothetical protein
VIFVRAEVEWVRATICGVGLDDSGPSDLMNEVRRSVRSRSFLQYKSWIKIKIKIFMLRFSNC